MYVQTNIVITNGKLLIHNTQTK